MLESLMNSSLLHPALTSICIWAFKPARLGSARTPPPERASDEGLEREPAVVGVAVLSRLVGGGGATGRDDDVDGVAC